MTSQTVIPVVIDRHAEDAAFLWLLRDAAISEPHYDLKDLAELDNRLEAHLDGLRIAGDYAWDVAREALAIGEPGEVFVAGWLAVDTLDGQKLDLTINVAKTSHENQRALASALAWHPAESIRNLIQSLLNANDPDYLALGITTCALHRIDPGEVLKTSLRHANEQLVARSLRATGELGRHDLLGDISRFQNSDIRPYHFWSNWSAAMLGDTPALASLKHHILSNSEFAAPALQLVARVMEPGDLRQLLQSLARDENAVRLAIAGAGISGDSFWIPGLLKYMAVPELARVAGEAFSMITGVDLAYQDLDEDQPEDFVSGPTEDPDDENVTLDEDEALAWPNAALLMPWWQENSQRFTSGSRYLCGVSICEQQCAEVLRTGFQRQRNAAALELALMGKPLFETRAPGWRQLKLLQH